MEGTLADSSLDHLINQIDTGYEVSEYNNIRDALLILKTSGYISILLLVAYQFGFSLSFVSIGIESIIFYTLYHQVKKLYITTRLTQDTPNDIDPEREFSVLVSYFTHQVTGHLPSMSTMLNGSRIVAM